MSDRNENPIEQCEMKLERLNDTNNYCNILQEEPKDSRRCEYYKKRTELIYKANELKEIRRQRLRESQIRPQ